MWVKTGRDNYAMDQHGAMTSTFPHVRKHTHNLYAELFHSKCDDCTEQFA